MAKIQKSPSQIQEENTNQLYKDCGVFWAFSKKQFLENKTPLKEGEKYVSMGGGGFLPQGNIQKLKEGMYIIDKEYKEAITTSKEAAEKEILTALINNECFMTGDIQAAVDEFQGTFPLKKVHEVYLKHRAAQSSY